MVIISVVVMAYNEENTLEAVVCEIKEVLEKLNQNYEIIIINDGSNDDTAACAAKLSTKSPKIRVIEHNRNEGLGQVYRTGFLKSKGEYLTFFPADGQFPANIIEKFYLLMGNADMILGYLPNRKCSLLAKVLSFAERVLLKFLFGQLPKFQGILMFRKALLKEVELNSTGRAWTVLMELIIKAAKKNKKIKSVPTEIRPRISGKSKVNNIKTILENLRQTIILKRYF